MDVIEKVFSKIGLEFDAEVGAYIHKKTNIPLTVHYDQEKEELVLLDQTKLPFEVAVWRTKDWREAGDPGIKGMIVRGSQAIGCAAGYAMLLAANSFRNLKEDRFTEKMAEAASFLDATRPTASPLRWAVELCMKAMRSALRDGGVEEAIEAIRETADYILASDLIMNWYLRQEGKPLISDGDVIMTHCNGGSLSSSFGGHALGMIEEAYAEGKDIMVISKETRPRSQGFKLTTWELNRAGVPVVIITDNMISSAIERFKVSKVLLGVDRVARDGSVANKIGSADIARVAALYGNIDFYYATSYSTIDLDTDHGSSIPIEERSIEEVTYPYRLEAQDKRVKGILSGKSLGEWPPKEVLVHGKPGKGQIAIYNPAFDVTPPKLIDLIITDIGVFAPQQIRTLTEEKITQIVRERLEKQGVTVPKHIISSRD
ncbi:MAG: s-methyl-5-thioribose-1-phosphate isomerase [Candidatus Freyarchaeota archaeon]|nr:s-methyl-5-thioribose-1-phosphate isomerase [Candidatus Freyrarchaeum guaymaensis]